MMPAACAHRSSAAARRLPGALWALESRLLSLALLAGACAACVATGWHSALRSVLAIAFLLLAPGWSLAELLAIASEPLHALVFAVALSISLDACVALSLLYAHVFSLALASAILIGLTLCASAGALLRAHRPAPLLMRRRVRPFDQSR